MADVVTPEVRSRMMSGIRSKNTRPELILRSGLHKAGFRFRLHEKSLPGKPDLVFRKYNAVVFVHGCFWHGHNCHLFKLPSTRRDFWTAKILRNREVDEKALSDLTTLGMRVGVVWECALKGRSRRPVPEIVSAFTFWLRSTQQGLEIRGTE